LIVACSPRLGVSSFAVSDTKLSSLTFIMGILLVIYSFLPSEERSM
jgi:hypothetical protein